MNNLSRFSHNTQQKKLNMSFWSLLKNTQNKFLSMILWPFLRGLLKNTHVAPPPPPPPTEFIYTKF